MKGRFQAVVCLSVVIPARNSEKHVRDCVASVLSQSFEDLEVLIVDDGSDDETPAIIDALSLQDERVQGYKLPGVGRGAAFARKFGAQRATGEFIHFVDSDDLVGEGCYDNVISMLRESGADGWVFGYQEIGDSTNTLLPHAKGISGNYPATIVRPEDLGTDLFSFTNPAVWNKIWRRNFLLPLVAEFSENLSSAGDLPYTYAAISSSRMLGISPLPMYFYRSQDSGSLRSAGPGLVEITRAIGELRRLVGPLQQKSAKEQSLNTLTATHVFLGLRFDGQSQDLGGLLDSAKTVIFGEWLPGTLSQESFASTGSFLFMRQLQALSAAELSRRINRRFRPLHPYGTIGERISRRFRELYFARAASNIYR